LRAPPLLATSSSLVHGGCQREEGLLLVFESNEDAHEVLNAVPSDEEVVHITRVASLHLVHRGVVACMSG